MGRYGDFVAFNLLIFTSIARFLPDGAVAKGVLRAGRTSYLVVSAPKTVLTEMSKRCIIV